MAQATSAVKRLKAELARRDWSQNELARKLGTDSAVVSRWMTGQRTPELKLAVAIERLLGIPAAAWIAPEAA